VKIARVEPFPVSYPEPNDHGRHRAVCLVKITADDGQVGWGECTTYFPDAARAAGLIVESLGKLIIGMDPVQTDTIGKKLYAETWWYGTTGGIAAFAISGIDIALWDLKGKALGASLVDLLGGPVKDRLPAIASSHATSNDIDEMAEEIAGWLETGLTGVKVGFGKLGDAHLGFEHDRDVAFMAAVREAIGPDKSIMIDCGVRNSWSLTEAIRRVRAFEEHDLDWIEEPLGHDDPLGYAQLKAAVTSKIAYGEREYQVQGVDRIIASGSCDVVGLDPGRIGGVTGFSRACDRIALVNRREANAHAWSTAIDTAVSLAISWAKPVCMQLEEQPFKGPMQDDLIGGAFVHTDGYMEIPRGPGLGVDVDESVVQRFLIA
jgi:L-alanine-DL-glutamate epimerase-like enolase superfamily enzyme